MIQIATALPTSVTVPVPPVLRVAESGADSFALALRSLVVPGAKPAAKGEEAAAPETVVPALQNPAEPGKQLPGIRLQSPNGETDAETVGDAKEEIPAEQDPAFVWFSLPAPPVATHPPVSIAAAVARAAHVQKSEFPPIAAEVPTTAAPKTPSTREPVNDAQSVVARKQASPEALAPAAIAMRAERENAAVPRAPAPLAEAVPATTQPIASATPQLRPADSAATAVPTPHAAIEGDPAAPPPQAIRDAQRFTAPVPIASILVAAPEIASAPALTAVALVAPTPAIFAPLLRLDRREPDQPAVSIAAPGAAAPQQVAATPDTQQGALDMRRQEWMGQMVERIEALRDAAPIRETRIALMPDALGKVDISVRHEGDRVHVHFAAETQAARQILTDAQPRFVELAESRGVRLGQTSVDAGQAGADPHSGQRQDAPRSRAPSAPVRARAAAFTETEDRVA